MNRTKKAKIRFVFGMIVFVILYGVAIFIYYNGHKVAGENTAILSCIAGLFECMALVIGLKQPVQV